MDDATLTLPAKSWEKRLFLITILVYLLASPILLLLLFFVELLWFYMGAVMACMIFPLAFFVAKRKGNQVWACLLSGFRWTVIGGGALGLVLASTVFVVPGYKSFTAGYWIHVKLWLNPTEVRQWALAQSNITNRTQVIRYENWPPSLKNATFMGGRVSLNPETKTVTLVEGGGFGVWGITVAQLPQTNELSGGYSIKLDKGAWVWHDTQ